MHTGHISSQNESRPIVKEAGIDESQNENDFLDVSQHQGPKIEQYLRRYSSTQQALPVLAKILAFALTSVLLQSHGA